MSPIKRVLTWLLFGVALSSCATLPQSQNPAKLPEPQADVMVERPANFRESLLNFFSLKPPEPTK